MILLTFEVEIEVKFMLYVFGLEFVGAKYSTCSVMKYMQK